ncbi:chemotaxis receptor (MCP) glutamine deamidase CheD [Methanohalophilus levihalophilus]|nr:chemotaxis receptor (MCP) glutamine deamidase CheD [Methanohalophilus levihalophilus]
MTIGERNIKETKLTLSRLDIPIIAEDIGKNHGRTIVFDTGSGELLVKSFLCGEVFI